MEQRHISFKSVIYDRKYILFLSLSFLLLFVIIIGRHPFRKTHSLFVSDGFGYYIYLPSIFIDKDLDLENQIKHQPSQLNHWTFAYSSHTKKRGNIFQVGCAVLWAPFFLCAHSLVLFLNKLGFSISSNGFGYWYEIPVYVGSFLYGIMGVTIMLLFLSKLFDYASARYATFFIVFASPLAAYLYFEPDMSHVVSFFLISLFFYCLYSIYQSSQIKNIPEKYWFFLGILFGFILLVRVPDALTGLLALFVCFYINRLNMRSFVLSGFLFLLGSFISFIPQLLVWKSLYGSYFVMPPNPFYLKIDWSHPDILNYFFSSRHGLFFWTPILLFSFVGLILGFFKRDLFFKVSALVLIFAFYFNSVIYGWWIGCSFGERRMVDYMVIFSMGLCYLFSNFCFLKNKKSLLFLSFLVLFNWFLMLRYFTHDLPEYGSVPVADFYVNTLLYPIEFLKSLLF